MTRLWILGFSACLGLACATATPLAQGCEPEEVVVVEYTAVSCSSDGGGTVCDLAPAETRVSSEPGECGALAQTPPAPAEPTLVGSAF